MDAVQLGQAAANFKDSTAFQTAVEQVREDVIHQWEQADTIEEREEAHGTMRGLNRLLNKLDSLVGDGEVAQARRESQ